MEHKPHYNLDPLSGTGGGFFVMRLLAILVLGGTPWFSIWTEADEPPASSDAEVMVEHIEQVATLVDKNSQDCDAAAAALTEYATKHGDQLREATERLDALPEEKQAELQAEFRPRLEKALARMTDGISNCRGHEAFDEAMQSLSTAPAEPEDVCRKWRRVLADTESESCDVVAAGLELLEAPDTPLACVETLAEETRTRCPKSTAVKEQLSTLTAAARKE